MDLDRSTVKVDLDGGRPRGRRHVKKNEEKGWLARLTDELAVLVGGDAEGSASDEQDEQLWPIPACSSYNSIYGAEGIYSLEPHFYNQAKPALAILGQTQTRTRPRKSQARPGETRIQLGSDQVPTRIQPGCTPGSILGVPGQTSTRVAVSLAPENPGKSQAPARATPDPLIGVSGADRSKPVNDQTADHQTTSRPIRAGPGKVLPARLTANLEARCQPDKNQFRAPGKPGSRSPKVNQAVGQAEARQQPGSSTEAPKYVF